MDASFFENFFDRRPGRERRLLHGEKYYCPAGTTLMKSRVIEFCGLKRGSLG